MSVRSTSLSFRSTSPFSWSTSRFSRSTTLLMALGLVALVLVAGCHAHAAAHDIHAGRAATVTLAPLGGSGVAGHVTFTEADSGVVVKADVTGLAPGKHGFHIHEYGDCSAADGSSAGSHFDAGHHQHGAPGASTSHTGDLGNLSADADGRATLNVTLPRVMLDPGPDGIAGRSVVVHEKEDDLQTPPAGNSGKRLACGVILVQGEGTRPVKP